MTTIHVWEKADDAFIERLWRGGHSMANIAKAMKARGAAVTRCSVAGRLFRRGFCHSADKAPLRVKGQRRSFKGLSRSELCDTLKTAVEPTPRGPAGNFTHGCKWIHGDPRTDDWRQCGHIQKQNSPYCEHHHRRAYNFGSNAPIAQAKATA